jgi:hypothetical protein
MISIGYHYAIHALDETTQTQRTVQQLPAWIISISGSEEAQVSIQGLIC